MKEFVSRTIIERYCKVLTNPRDELLTEEEGSYRGRDKSGQVDRRGK
jgi:hypothetical protein